MTLLFQTQIKKLFHPQIVADKVEEYVYQYTVSEDDEGAANLRFWRGNSTSLWNCSMVLSYEEYSNGFDCIKIYGWNGNGDSLEKREEENIGRSITWDEMQDTDGDGVPDSYERDNGMDIENPDTDGDGLNDGFEILYASTDPLKASTMENGILDSELDIDEDGLSNAEEYLQGTAPLSADTDDDGLMDGEELTVYHTDPLNPDTDGDGIRDGDEILIGINPLDAETFGYPDAEYQSVQKIDAGDFILEEINQGNENYQLSLEIETKGSAYEDLLVRESAYSEVMENRSILGIIPEIMYKNEENMERMELSFTIDSKNIYEEYSSKDFEGIKRYNIFWYDENENLLIPVNTVVNEEENTISTTVDEVGTYCIIDMEKWLSDLGYEIVEPEKAESTKDAMERAVVKGMLLVAGEEEKIPATTTLTSDYRSVESVIMAGGTETESKDKIDVVINLNNNVEGLTEAEFDSIKANIEIIGRSLFYETEDVRIYVLDQHGEVVKTSFGQSYANNTTQLSSMIQKLLNSKPETPYIDKQASAMLEKIELREEAFKVSVFIGNSYLTSYSDGYIGKIANANIHCCIVEPLTEYGSWYYKLAQRTKGLLIYSYIHFSDNVLNYIYGYVPDVPIPKYRMVSGMSIKTIILKQELQAYGPTDTDGDGLKDWEEVNQAKVKVNADRSVQLPTYKEYIDQYESRWPLYRGWSNRFSNVSDVKGKSLSDMLSEIYVLPVLSDPTKADGDNDGVLDKDETKWDGIDKRYEKVGPMHKDTVETLFPVLKRHRQIMTSNPYLEINDNDVILYLNVIIKGDKNNLASNSLDLGTDDTLKDLAINGIVDRWSGSYDGNQYDFYEGLKVNFRVEISETSSPSFFRNIIEITIKDNVCGVSNMSNVDWKAGCNRFVTVYSSYCGDKNHNGKDASNCETYQKKLFTPEVYEGTIAHEFGHVFGLMDMYSDSYANHGYEPISNEEILYYDIFYGYPQARGIMKVCGEACANDIEMVLFAFEENTWQYFVPYGKEQKISKAIKSNVEYRLNTNSSQKFIWNSSTYKFEVLPEENRK